MHQPIETRLVSSPRWPTILTLILAIATLVALARSVLIVDQAEAVYVTEFGRSVRLIDEPGLHWKWPYQSRRGQDTPDLRASMARYKVTEGWYDFGRSVYDRR